jgi:hypothetical protein
MKWLLSVLVLALNIWAIFNIWNSRAETLPKVLWTAGVLVFPVAGFIAWFFLGPKAKA